jgi:chaperonin GroES
VELNTKLKLKEIVKSPNVAELLDEEDLETIGRCVVSDWEVDKNSRSDWEEKTAMAMKLATQIAEEKTFPWAGAANVKFPLVTIAALQYSSRAYPMLIPGTNVVKARVIGVDATGEKAAKAQRISEYMSYQLLEEDTSWEENMDKALICQAIVGCAFKKTYFDAVRKHNVSEHVLAKDLYIPYYASSLEKASRITQVLYYTKNDLIEQARRGLFLECEDEENEYPAETTLSSPLDEVEQESQGLFPVTGNGDAPYELLEQHGYLDLDGDGYKEPYIITVRKDTAKVLRIVARYTTSSITKNRKGEVITIKPRQYYTKFSFIPSPDGGIYDLGFGVLLGPLNESINTILNQLIDAGTLSITAGGFLGRGVKFRSGDNSFRPFEWKRVDSTGDDLQKGIFPLPVREPSPVLFQLLGLLIDYGERIGMATDPLVGQNPGQNTPAETSRNMLQEGQRIFSAVFKRTYRCLKEEFRKLYVLNSIYLNEEQEFYSLINGQSSVVFLEDFYGDSKDIVPAADPNMVSDESRINQAIMLRTAAGERPGLYNSYVVEKRFVEALKVQDIESVLPDPQGPNALPAPPPDSKVVIETMKLQQKDKEFQSEIQFKLLDLQQEAQYLAAEIAEKESRSVLNIAQAEGIEAGHQVAALQQSVALMKQRQDGLLQTMKILQDLQKMHLEKTKVENESNQGGVSTTSNK